MIIEMAKKRKIMLKEALGITSNKVVLTDQLRKRAGEKRVLMKYAPEISAIKHENKTLYEINNLLENQNKRFETDIDGLKSEINDIKGSVDRRLDLERQRIGHSANEAGYKEGYVGAVQDIAFYRLEGRRGNNIIPGYEPQYYEVNSPQLVFDRLKSEIEKGTVMTQDTAPTGLGRLETKPGRMVSGFHDDPIALAEGYMLKPSKANRQSELWFQGPMLVHDILVKRKFNPDTALPSNYHFLKREKE
jgi:hypothetical protein